ncbi:sodium-dependent transporter [Thiomicrorhabdus aquaedulcis]|uniref:sodium-dependent transporter n=1 Tax=Thiomicrorhabdus aquaedulcis TaxID=2211106 RepID=UPI000FD7FE7B|nr:sodium-dependent transporter [Thiomicrorhabdus aquaedulcis]
MPSLKLSNKVSSTVLRETWSTKRIFILAAVGSAVGLGNLWKFPYITGENGGGAFVLVYLGCVLLLGLPILMSEITLGRAGQGNPVHTMQVLAKRQGASRLWSLLGVNGLLAGALILSFYTVIAGWGVAYFFDSAQGVFQTMSAQQASEHLTVLLANPLQLLWWHTVVTVLTVWIVARGVRKGLEVALNFMMPALLLILLVLLGYAMTTTGFEQSVQFMFAADFSKLSWQAVLVAMGHAFFTLSIGLGTMMVYGSYFERQHSIASASLWVAVVDTLVALLAGVVIFSIVFANGLATGSGPGLLFSTLPIAFGQMSGGWFFGTLFFALVVFAALTSAISLLEPSVSWLNQRFGIGRIKAACGLGFATWLLGVGTVLSFNMWQNVHFMGTRTLFESLDFMTTNIMLPLGGMFMAVFVAWVFKDQDRAQEMALPKRFSAVFLLNLKWFVPVAILWIFASNLVTGQAVWWVMIGALALYGLYVKSVLQTTRPG